MKQKEVSLYQNRKTVTNTAAAVFLAPVVILLIIFIAYPIFDSFHTSMYRWNGITVERDFVGMGNWKDLSSDRSFWLAFLNNIILMISSILIQLPIGLALATFLDFGGKKLNIFKIIWFLPMLMSSVAIGFLFRYVLATNGGLISTIATFFAGRPMAIDLLGDPNRALLTVVMVICWQYVPFYMVFFMAAYTNMSYDIYEASRIDGASRGQYFWRIALPLLMPAFKSAAILSLVGSLKYFDLIYSMTGGGPGTSTELMATYMYKQSFKTFNMGYGATVACGMFILISLISLVTMRLINTKRGEI